jgi:hypothetical protein
MKTILIDVDSGERDPTVYPNPNDYTVRLSDTLYGVTKLRIVEASIPNCQTLINYGNKQFQLDNRVYVLNEGSYTNGTDLASNLQQSLSGSNVSQVTFSSFTNKLTFSNCGTSNAFSFKFFSGSNGYSTSSTVGPPCATLGFSGSDVRGIQDVVSNVIDLSGPTALFVRISYKEEEFEKDIYVDGGQFTFGNTAGQQATIAPIPPIYIGRIVLGPRGERSRYNMTNYPIEYNVPNLNIDQLSIRFYWNNGNKLVPYDFGKQNHIMKFEIVCDEDRLSRVYEEGGAVDSLPPPVEKIPERFRRDTIFMAALGLILFIGLIILLR